MTLAYNGLHNDDDPGLDSDDGTRIEFRMEPVLKRSRRLTPKDIALDYSCRTQDPDGFRVELFETKGNLSLFSSILDKLFVYHTVAFCVTCRRQRAHKDHFSIVCLSLSVCPSICLSVCLSVCQIISVLFKVRILTSDK